MKNLFNCWKPVKWQSAAKIFVNRKDLTVEEEIWSDVYIDNKVTHYQVSSLGRVYNSITKKYLKPRMHTSGYKQVSLYINKKEHRFYIHRLVLLHFNPIILGDINQVNHINGIKDDNRLVNLEWVNNSKNQKHAYSIGLKKNIDGENNYNSKYTNKQIHKVCKMLEKHIPYSKISEKTNVDYNTISDIKCGRRWRHIKSQYNI